MNSVTTWTYSVRDITGSETPASATMEFLSTKQRLTAATKQFLIFFIVALAFVPIPFLHFFLVPIFLITAFVRGGLALTGRYLIREFSGSCPACSKPLSWRNLKPKKRWREACEHCRVVLTVEEKG